LENSLEISLPAHRDSRLVATYKCSCTQRGGIRDPNFLIEHSILS